MLHNEELPVRCMHVEYICMLVVRASAFDCSTFNLLVGDFNADGGYFPEDTWPEVLKQMPRYKMLSSARMHARTRTHARTHARARASTRARACMHVRMQCSAE